MKYILVSTMLLLSTLHVKAQDTLSRPAQQVLDQAHLFTTAQKEELLGMLGNLKKAEESYGYLLVIDSLPDNQNLLAYTKGIFKKWELNTSDAGKNFVMIYSIKEHGVRIEASDKLIQILTKAYLQEVIDRSIKPSLKKRQDFQGIKRGIEMIALKIENN